MIVFEWDYETHNSDGTLKERPTWWLSCTSVTDKDHEEAIYEQLDAEQVFNV
jgi:hypothetical protein